VVFVSNGRISPYGPYDLDTIVAIDAAQSARRGTRSETELTQLADLETAADFEAALRQPGRQINCGSEESRRPQANSRRISDPEQIAMTIKRSRIRVRSVLTDEPFCREVCAI